MAVVVLILAYLACTGRLTPPVDVQTAKVARIFPSRALTTLNASGYVVAQRKAAVSSKATGRLEHLYVEEGKVVKQGEILATLENQDLKATLAEARASVKVAGAALENAEAELQDATLNYDRQKALRETASVSAQAFDTAEARYKKAKASIASARFGIERVKAAVKEAEVNLEYSLIRAPFDGVILTKSADEGEVVAPFGAAINAKAAVATMADMTSLMVEVDVAESGLEKVKVGGATEISLDAFPNDRFPGTVYMIVPTADRSKATVLTKVKFNKLDPKVLPEMSAKVAFLSRPLKNDEDNAFLGIPLCALKKVGNQDVVFRINGSRTHLQPVKVGRRWNDTVEILAGLKEGDTIALSPGEKLRDGRRVNVQE
ncbi:MAG: efflux RND transporter periplasmic adaptor subunit [Desulfomonilaceae bacterium]